MLNNINNEIKLYIYLKCVDLPLAISKEELAVFSRNCLAVTNNIYNLTGNSAHDQLYKLKKKNYDWLSPKKQKKLRLIDFPPY